MKKLFLIISILLLTQTSNLFAQQVLKENSMSDGYKNLSQERIYMHYSSSILFAGEYLFYKVYCINADTKELSRISEIAYVELIAENGEPIFKHKVELVKGEADSDFFIPTSVASGSYKLIAYTRWMKNWGLGNFFQTDIGIINPYRQNQKAILASSSDNNLDSDKTDTTQDFSADNTRTFGLYLNKQTFRSREAVMLAFKNFKGQLGHGKYSLSIRKVDDVSYLLDRNNLRSNAESFNKVSENKNAQSELFYIPEASGTNVSGKVIDKKSKLPSKQNVAISVSGKNFMFTARSTNENGAFLFSVDPDYENDKAIIQVIGDVKDDFKIIIDEDAQMDYSSLLFTPFEIDESLQDVITKRSVYNQIENGYYSIKPDTIRPKMPKTPFTNYEETTTFNLDDFTRFSTMKEVLTELVKHAWTGTDSTGRDVVKVRNYEYNKETEFLPLVFIDGVFVQDHDHLLDYNARKVEKISVIRDLYKFGTQYYQGVILVETTLKDYQNQLSGDYLKNVELFQPRSRKTYFKQSYSTGTTALDGRTPDYRSQLLWQPNIELSSNEMNFQFVTSDNLGQYEISLEGFTDEGKPVSLRQMFRVE